MGRIHPDGRRARHVPARAARAVHPVGAAAAAVRRLGVRGARSQRLCPGLRRYSMSVTTSERTNERSAVSAMHVADLLRLYRYSYWATAKLIEAMEALTPEQFTQSVAGSYESIRNTLVHAMSAEWGWLDRSGGLARGPKLD